MITQLYNLKQQQINQQVLLKQQALSKIKEIDDELLETNTYLHTASVDIMGAISDFRVLQIHKMTMKEHMVKLAQNKEKLKKQIEYYDNLIIGFNKESEQFDYIIQENKKEKIKNIIKAEEEVSSEYMQSKFIRESKNEHN
ncbi:MAG: hypothetical protein U9O56_06650 [Campylobacterota bacterium]|nr:hypothetical protein [Campylobacterota bacterium]